MEIVGQSVRIISNCNKEEAYKLIETAGRTCYRSANKENDEAVTEKFIQDLIKSGHTSVLEHYSITFNAVTSRATANELVRHRIASYSQESTRYCNYCNKKFKDGIRFILPSLICVAGAEAEGKFINKLSEIEAMYMELLNKYKQTPDIARSILPLCTATEITFTFNIRSLRNFLQLRLSKSAHCEIRELATLMLAELNSIIPVFFEDITEKYINAQNK